MDGMMWKCGAKRQAVAGQAVAVLIPRLPRRTPDTNTPKSSYKNTATTVAASGACYPNDDNDNANNANNFSYEKVSVSYDVVRTVFTKPKSLITHRPLPSVVSCVSCLPASSPCHPNNNNPNNPNNFSYEKVSVSYDVVRAVFAKPKSLITHQLYLTSPSACPFLYSCVAQAHAQYRCNQNAAGGVASE